MVEAVTERRRQLRRLLLAGAGLAALGAATGCSVPGTAPQTRAGSRFRYAPQNLLKTDLAHFLEAGQWQIFQSLQRLADKLYQRNPIQLQRGGAPSREAAMAALFDVEHEWHFEDLGGKRDIAALMLAFEPDFKGDRVRAFVVGLSSMVQTAFGNNVEFYLLNDVDAQHLYNAARNVEIAAWKLGTSRDDSGELLLLSNEINERVRNLSFEREIGRIIGVLEVLTDVVELKTDRTVVRFVQNVATAAFLPVY